MISIKPLTVLSLLLTSLAGVNANASCELEYFERKIESISSSYSKENRQIELNFNRINRNRLIAFGLGDVLSEKDSNKELSSYEESNLQKLSSDYNREELLYLPSVIKGIIKFSRASREIRNQTYQLVSTRRDSILKDRDSITDGFALCMEQFTKDVDSGRVAHSVYMSKIERYYAAMGLIDTKLKLEVAEMDAKWWLLYSMHNDSTSAFLSQIRMSLSGK